jgi:hypothetical protein
MSGSVFFEGNAYIDGGQVSNALVLSSSIGNCTITTSSLDMNNANITSVKDPVQAQDAATKYYVDALQIVFNTITLVGTNNTLISNLLQGSFVVTVNNLVSNGPSAVFHVTKNDSSRHGHVFRTVATPGYSSRTTLMVSWPPNSGILIYKTGSEFDGSYRVKLL